MQQNDLWHSYQKSVRMICALGSVLSAAASAVHMTLIISCGGLRYLRACEAMLPPGVHINNRQTRL